MPRREAVADIRHNDTIFGKPNVNTMGANIILNAQLAYCLRIPMQTDRRT